MLFATPYHSSNTDTDGTHTSSPDSIALENLFRTSSEEPLINAMHPSTPDAPVFFPTSSLRTLRVLSVSALRPFLRFFAFSQRRHPDRSSGAFCRCGAEGPWQHPNPSPTRWDHLALLSSPP